MHVANEDRLKPHEVRTSLAGLNRIKALASAAMERHGSMSSLKEFRELANRADSRYRKTNKFEDLLSYLTRTGILLPQGGTGHIFFDIERFDVIADARANQKHAPAAEPRERRIAEMRRRWQEHQDHILAVRANEAQDAKHEEEPHATRDAPPAPSDPPRGASGEEREATAPTPSRKHRKRERLEPSPGADKVLYLTPNEEERWEREPWFGNPERYFVIPIQKREECPVPARLAEIISFIEMSGFEVQGKELVRDAFDRLCKQVDPDKKLNQATTYLKVAGYRPDYPTNGWGVIFLWKKGQRILTGVEGYGRFTYVPTEGPIRRQHREHASRSTQHASPERRPPASKAPTPLPAAPVDPYASEAIVSLSDTALQAFHVRVRAEIRRRLDARQAALEARKQKLASEMAAYTTEELAIKKERLAQLGEPSDPALSN